MFHNKILPKNLKKQNMVILTVKFGIDEYTDFYFKKPRKAKECGIFIFETLEEAKQKLNDLKYEAIENGYEVENPLSENFVSLINGVDEYIQYMIYELKLNEYIGF